MTIIVHRGHVEHGEAQFGATLTLNAGSVVLDVANTADQTALPERLELVRFTSNTGYFTLINLLRRNQNIRFGVGSLSTFSVGLAVESGFFQAMEEIRSPTWSMTIEDIAKILHVNGVVQQLIMPETGGFLMNWSIVPASAVDLVCPETNIIVRLGQHIQTGGNAIDGPTIALTYPADLIFPEPTAPEGALRTMHRMRQFFSLFMGRILALESVKLRFETADGLHEMPLHGLLPTESSDKPQDRLIHAIDAAGLGQMLDRWLTRYDGLEDAIRLHMSGLEQRKLPTELRFQIFVQALEALHRRTASGPSTPIDGAPVLAALRAEGIPNDIVDRVEGVLAHAHEPGLRRRLREYWDSMVEEIAALRPGLNRSTFISRVVATRNHYAHRTDRGSQVLERADLWDATELIKAMSHIALLQEVGADVTGVGHAMVHRRFAEFVVRGDAS